MSSSDSWLCPATADVDEIKVTASLHCQSGGEADMLLYCISLFSDSKIGEQDMKTIKLLTRAFGTNIWKHTILVFTFVNAVKLVHPERDIRQLVESYAQEFQLVLQRVCQYASFFVVSIFSCDQDETKRDPFMIVALPAGNNPDEELVEGMKWDESIYIEALKKCKRGAIPALLKVREPSPKIIQLGMEIGGFFSQSRNMLGIGLGLGALTGTVVGGILGGGVGLLAGGVRGIRPGADLGSNIGINVGCASIGGLGMLSMISGIEYKEDQAQLEKIHQEIKRQTTS